MTQTHSGRARACLLFGAVFCLMPFSRVLAAAQDERPADKREQKEPLPPRRTIGPIDRNHHLGPADRLSIEVPSAPQYSRTVELRTDGTFEFRPVGTVQAVGLTTAELKEKMTEALRKYVLRPDVQITLEDIYIPPKPLERVPRIMLLGALNKKGVVDLPEPRPLRTVLVEAGPTEKADLATIRVRYPADGSARDVDLESFFRTGDLKDDLLIKGGEEIIVRERLDLLKSADFVRIGGMVASPNKYEWKPDMDIEDLILQAGKLTPMANVERVELRRTGKAPQTVNLLEQHKKGLDGRIVLGPNDAVWVPGYDNTVIVIGATATPGYKPLKPGTKISEFFLYGPPDVVAGIHPATVDLRAVEVIRGNNPGKKVNLEDLIKKRKKADDLALENGDVIFLPPKEAKQRKGLGEYLNILSPLGFLFGGF